jgi:hypothetical protein
MGNPMLLTTYIINRKNKISISKATRNSIVNEQHDNIDEERKF